jgi:hypothetical protein
MKAISAPRTGVHAADRAERGLGPLRHPWVSDRPSPPYLPKGAKGGGVRWSTTVLVSSLAPQSAPRGPPVPVGRAALGKGLKGGSPSCPVIFRTPRLDIDVLVLSVEQQRDG